MRAIISAKLLTSMEAQPQAKPFEISDPRLKGFILRVQPSGARSYYAQHGRGRRTLVGVVGHLQPDEARERCGKILGNVAHGRPPLYGLDGTDSLTLGEFIGPEVDPPAGTYRLWLKANKPKGAVKTLRRLKVCFGSWYSLPLTDITLDRVENWRTDRLAKGRTQATVVRDLMALSGVLTRAVKLGKGNLTKNVVREVEKPKVDRLPKTRYLSTEEAQRLRAALLERDTEIQSARESANRWRAERHQDLLPKLPHYGDYLTAAVVLSLNTGLRQGELTSLTWSAVDLKKKMITIEGSKAKSSQTRHIPLNSEAVSVLERWREQCDGERVFPLGWIKTAWAALLGRAHIENFRWHDLRHDFGSRLAQAGVPLNTIRELLGHGSIQMTLRYAHLSPSSKSDAVAKLTEARV